MPLIEKHTFGGFPASQALHWNEETHQKLGCIIYDLMQGNPEKVKDAYCRYYELKRHFIEYEFEDKIEALELFRKERGFSSVRGALELVRGQLIATSDLKFNIDQEPDIPEFEKPEKRKAGNMATPMKSKITKISFSLVKNLGNYETCRVEAEAEIHPDEKPTDVMKKLQAWVENQTEKSAAHND